MQVLNEIDSSRGPPETFRSSRLNDIYFGSAGDEQPQSVSDYLEQDKKKRHTQSLYKIKKPARNDSNESLKLPKNNPYEQKLT
jgi:hypothetical protein